MKLKNVVATDRNVIMILMNCIQNIPVAGNLLLISVSGHCFLPHQRIDPVGCCDNAFHAIGCLGTLDFRDFNKFVKFCRFLPQIQILLSFVFVNQTDQVHGFDVPTSISQKGSRWRC